MHPETKKRLAGLVANLGMILVSLGWLLVLALIVNWIIRREDSLWIALFLIGIAIPLLGIIIYIVCLPYVPFIKLDMRYYPEKYLRKCPKCNSASYYCEEVWGANYGTVGYSYLEGYEAHCNTCGYSHPS